jgi:hypothetical protein
VKRFLKTSALLIASLFVVVSGFDAALDHIAHCPSQSSFTVYNEQGGVLFAFDGDLSVCKAYAKPGPAVTPSFLHRT